ncbi:wHTH domain-containing protein [Amycolatopsis japonica]|uniref:wHTH domain-containing protein n=1 Tax=Amycolatopsis japonica TaxID=208439 RepID=UPI00380B0658
MPSTDDLEALHALCADLKRLHVECHQLTLDKLAKVCHLSRAQVGAILNGDIRRLPDLDVVLAIVRKCASYAVDHEISLSLSTSDDYWRKIHGSVERSLARRRVSPKQAARDPWIELVEEHTGEDAVGRQAVAVAKHLTTERRAAIRKIKGDPWLDPDLASRVVDHAIALTTEFLDEDTKLSASETALLVIAPLLHQVTWLRAAAQAEVNPLDLRQTGARSQRRADFERFLRGRQQQRLVARTIQHGLSDRPANSAEIGWWLLHRWLDTQQPDTRASVPLDDVINDRRLRGTLLDPLHRLVRLFRLSVGELSSSERLDLPAQHGDSLGTPGVRVRLIGLILVVAHSLAVEIAALPSTIVEHLGIPEAVDLDELYDTLKNSEWRRGGSDLGLWLHAECRHEAVLDALTEHVGRTDTLLATVRTIAQHDVTLQPLRALPTRAYADQIRPSSVDGEPLFIAPVTRFRIDETRVRELLMGEQLYRDRSLAVRELYQNALDACRYRKARHEFQARTWGWHSNWEGEIKFDQSVDADGRRYLRCQDNGVGMSELDLREVFSQAGIRFADRHEFAEEQADWDKCGVEFYPNSRFGIGVMSYFMLGDEIEVTTCRMSRQIDTPGPLLKVVIAGPGHLFRIKKIAEHGEEPGTEVKIYLRSPEDTLSCVRTLRALLGIAEFTTSAEHDGVHANWKPFVFQPRERQTWEPHGINAYGRIEPAVASEHGQVIWCEHGGALLADGIYVQAKEQSYGLASLSDVSDPRGAVINLTGSSAPVLTVDRMSVLDDVSDRALTLLNESTQPLVQPKNSLLSYKWLLDISTTSPGIADLITVAAANAGRTLQLGEHEVDVRRSGVTEIDAQLTETPGLLPESRLWNDNRRDDLDHLFLWRLIALIDDPLGSDTRFPEAGQIRAALPSDKFITGDWNTNRDYFFNEQEIPVGFIAKKARLLGDDIPTIVHRISELGLATRNMAARISPTAVVATDAVLLSLKLDGKPPWLPADKPVKLAHIIAASLRAQLPPIQTKDRLQRFGFMIEADTLPTVPLDSSDLRIISMNLNSEWPWIDTTTPTSALHVTRAAQLGQRPFSYMAKRLSDLGFTVAGGSYYPDEIDRMSSQLRLALEELTSSSLSTFYKRSRVILAAARSNCPPSLLGRTLKKLGVEIVDTGVLPEKLESSDIRILMHTPGASLIRLNEALEISRVTDITVHEIRERMSKMGFETDFSVKTLRLLDRIGRRILAMTEIYLQTRSELSLATIVKYAGNLGDPLSSVVKSLSNIGCILPDTTHLPEYLLESDARLLCRNPPQGLHESIPSTIPIPLAHLARLAYECKSEPKIVANRLRQLGYTVPPPEIVPQQFTEEDLRLLSWESWERVSWQDAYKIVPIGDLIRAAIRCRISLPQTAERMMALGLKTPDLAEMLPPLLAKVPKQ